MLLNKKKPKTKQKRHKKRRKGNKTKENKNKKSILKKQLQHWFEAIFRNRSQIRSTFSENRCHKN